MQHKQDLAIVLRTVVFEERHRIVTALTENHGRISALARNSIQSRRFGGSLDAFTAADWRFVETRPGADLFRLEEAQVRRGFENLRKDFERLSMASLFNELMIKLAPEHEPCPDLFRMHANALAVLDEATGQGADITLLNGYLAKVLQWSGNQPQMQHCLKCSLPLEAMEREDSLSCVVADAGWICASCRSAHSRHVQGFHSTNLRVTPQALQDLQLSLSLPIRQIPERSQASKEEHKRLFSYLEALLIYHIPGFDQVPLKSLRFLELQSNVQLPSANLR